MSPTIWTQCGRRTEPLRARAWRVVEAQHRVSTLKLVDTLEEQEILEQVLDASKPARPPEPEFDGLHYLLATPFRYPPLRHGSRFGRRSERGLWYGSAAESTALAEVAFYRLLFLEGTTAELPHVASEHTGFAVDLATARGVDLTRPPFARYRDRLASPTSYTDSQALGSAMREDGVEAFRYGSARDPDGGDNFGVFTPAAFATRSPQGRSLHTWHCMTTRLQVVFRRRDVLGDRLLSFPREMLAVAGEVISPAI